MTIREQIRFGDIGTSLRFYIQEEGYLVDVSGAVLKIIFLEKPDGSVVAKAAQSYGIYGVQYITVGGDLDQIGHWRAQTYIGLVGGYWKSSITSFRVHENLV